MAILDKLRLSGVTYDLVDSTAVHSLEGYWTSGQTNNAITAATNALAESIAEQGYQTASDVQNAISGKANSSDVYTKTEVNQAISGKADASDLVSLFGYAEYDSATQRINFKHTSTGSVISYIDASDFIKDGMVSNVEIVNGNLVITFNSDAGKQAISIPISDIFDASNYYTKAEVDGIASGKSNVADTVTAVGVNFDKTNGIMSLTQTKNGTQTTPFTLIAGNGLKLTEGAGGIDQSIAVDTDTIQTKLVSGTSIKTVNNESILGSGNITVSSGLSAEVQGTTLILS